MKALKNHNNMILEMTKKNSTRRELNKIKKFMKARYKYSSSYNSSVLSLDSSESSISYLSDLEI